MAVISRQQIPPLLVSVGVGVGCAAVAGRQQIAYRVVCIGVGFLERSPGIVHLGGKQLALGIVGIGGWYVQPQVTERFLEKIALRC